MSVLSEMLMQFLLLAEKRRTLRGLTLGDALRAVLTGLYTAHYARFSTAFLQMYVLPVKTDPQRVSLPGVPQARPDHWYLEKRLFVKQFLMEPVHLWLVNWIRSRMTNGELTYRVREAWIFLCAV